MAEPTDGDPFIEGMDAFGRGVPCEACPYRDGSDERELWLSGWEEAKRLHGGNEHTAVRLERARQTSHKHGYASGSDCASQAVRHSGA